jgi:hypothetical protein
MDGFANAIVNREERIHGLQPGLVFVLALVQYQLSLRALKRHHTNRQTRTVHLLLYTEHSGQGTTQQDEVVGLVEGV